MTQINSEIIRDSFEVIRPNSSDFSKQFYNRLFDQYPSVRPLFPSEMEPQEKKLIEALSLVIQNVDNLENMSTPLRLLGERHTMYGTTLEHYDAVGSCLIWTLKQVLKNNWSIEAELAWTALYSNIVRLMTKGATTQAPSSHPI